MCLDGYCFFSLCIPSFFEYVCVSVLFLFCCFVFLFQEIMRYERRWARPKTDPRTDPTTSPHKRNGNSALLLSYFIQSQPHHPALELELCLFETRNLELELEPSVSPDPELELPPFNPTPPHSTTPPWHSFQSQTHTLELQTDCTIPLRSLLPAFVSQSQLHNLELEPGPQLTIADVGLMFF